MIEKTKISQRSNLFDNIKGVAILLVVLGHAFEWYRDYLPIQYVYLFIYSFHMPLFLFVSGYFSKSVHAERNALVKLLPTYILFELVYSIFLFIATDQRSFSLLIPLSAFWYLVALIIYRVFLTKFSKNNKIIPVLFLMGLIVGFDSSTRNGVLGLQRVISLSGFFMLGYFMTEEKVEKLRKHKIFGFVLGGMAVIAMVIWYNCNSICGLDVGFRDVYVNCWGWCGRLLHYCIGLLMIGTMIIFTPEKNTLFCRLGRKSLSIYLLHVFFIGVIRAVNPFTNKPTINFIFLIMESFLLVFVLSSRVVTTLLDKLLNELSRLMNRLVK